MACSLNGQEGSFDWPPERAQWRCLARSGLPAVSRESYNESSTDQVLSVKMAGCWPCSFYAVCWTWTSCLCNKDSKKERGQCAAILS